jgi:hypothetical protein
MLRAPIRQKFIEILEESYFGIDNFIVNFDDGELRILWVIFLPNTDFNFEVERQGANGMATIEAPGEKYLTSERFTTSGIEISAVRLRNWVKRIHEEVVSTNPFAREISALRAELDQRMSALGHELEGYFTREEACVLKEQFEKFSSRLNDMAGENAELREALESMTKTIDDLKSATDLVNKGTWFRMSSGRLLTGLKNFAKSKEVREFALETAKKVLLEGPK